MAHPTTDTPVDITAAVNALVTEDDEPVDNIFSEKQQRLLTEPLYSSWTPPPEEDQPDHPRPFWAAANVGIFPSLHQPPLVPDVFVSLDVSVPDNMFEQSHRSYFFWEFGKAPEVVIEIVSNRKGGAVLSKEKSFRNRSKPGCLVPPTFGHYTPFRRGLGGPAHMQPRTIRATIPGWNGR